MFLNLGAWNRQPKPDIFSIAGISGGRTSAMMAALLDPSVLLTFQNTGREHPETYTFLSILEHYLGRKILWLEFRPPKKLGSRPRDFEFAIVNYQTAARHGEPFKALLDSLAAFRATKGLGPIAPWARSRICTAYLKHRLMRAYLASIGVDSFDQYVGLRADEPERVRALVSRDTQRVESKCLLFDLGITKADVNEFWLRQPFNLELQPYQGNCTGCFLKDQADLARSLQEPETDFKWWHEIEKAFPGFGGANFAGYRRLYLEGPVRQRIERELRERGLDADVANEGELNPHRFKLVVRQERRRLIEASLFSCSCEQAEVLGDADPDTEDEFILKLGETNAPEA